MLALMVAAGRARRPPPVRARRPQPQPPRVIEITAERFAFWPSEITIADGEEVELRIKSDDTTHGFRIVGTGRQRRDPEARQGRSRRAIRRHASRAATRSSAAGCVVPAITSCVASSIVRER